MRDLSSRLQETRSIIGELYRRPFNSETLQGLSSQVCRLVGADWFSLYIDGPDSRHVTNTPPGYTDIYRSVSSQDHLKQAMLAQNRSIVISRTPGALTDPAHREFNQTCQKARFITDNIYTPLRYKSHYRGFWAIARTRPKEPSFNDDDLAMAEFILQFFNDAYERSLLPPVLESETAWINEAGQILQAGDRMGEVLARVQASGGLEALRRACLDFLRQPPRIGADRFCTEINGQRLVILLSPLPQSDLVFRDPDLPVLKASLQAVPSLGAPDLDFAKLGQRFGFTPRELEIIQGLLQGKSNKELAYDLKIEEATVKRHTHNIYGKSGFGSRTGLILGLTPTLGFSETPNPTQAG